MATALIRLGDITSHGGSVIEASGHCDSNNLGLARTGDLTSRPILGLRQNPIISGDISSIIDSSPVAHDGDQTGCGTTLIASQSKTTNLV
jgi:uncharacterized Zn-binding protein involved in type VI secretion